MQSFSSQLIIEAVQSESETSTDELTLNHETYIRSTHRTSSEAWTNSSHNILSNQRLKKKSTWVDRKSDTDYRDLQKISIRFIWDYESKREFTKREINTESDILSLRSD